MAYTNLLVRDFMTRSFVSFTPDTDVEHAIKLILSKNLMGAPVVEHNKLVGVLAEGDVFRLLANRVFGIDNEVGGHVRDFMTTEVVTVRDSDDLASVCSRFMSHFHRGLPVVDRQNNVVGLVSRRVLLKAMVDLRRRPVLDRYPDYRRPQG